MVMNRLFHNVALAIAAHQQREVGIRAFGMKHAELYTSYPRRGVPGWHPIGRTYPYSSKRQDTRLQRQEERRRAAQGK